MQIMISVGIVDNAIWKNDICLCHRASLCPLGSDLEVPSDFRTYDPSLSIRSTH